MRKIKIIALSTVFDIHLNRDVFVFDLNPSWSYDKNRVPGSFNIGSIFSEKDLPELKESILIFYSLDHKCILSAIAARHAAALGYQNIFIMKAGISGWILKGLPIESDRDHIKKSASGQQSIVKSKLLHRSYAKMK